MEVSNEDLEKVFSILLFHLKKNDRLNVYHNISRLVFAHGSNAIEWICHLIIHFEFPWVSNRNSYSFEPLTCVDFLNRIKIHSKHCEEVSTIIQVTEYILGSDQCDQAKCEAILDSTIGRDCENKIKRWALWNMFKTTIPKHSDLVWKIFEKDASVDSFREIVTYDFPANSIEEVIVAFLVKEIEPIDAATLLTYKCTFAAKTLARGKQRGDFFFSHASRIVYKKRPLLSLILVFRLVLSCLEKYRKTDACFSHVINPGACAFLQKVGERYIFS